MDAILTAGGKPRPDEPLYAQTMGGYKAMLDINGKPMIQWTLDALDGSDAVERIVIVGLPVTNLFDCRKPILMVADQGGLLENLRAGIGALGPASPGQKALAVSSDLPAITTEMVDWVAARVAESDHDVYYNVVQRPVMEARYPGSRRTYVRLKELEVCGADLNAIDLGAMAGERPVWNRVIESRKSAFKQAALIGLDTMLLLALRQLSLQQAEAVVSRRLGLRGRVLVNPYPEVGMDVDKPNQLDMMRTDLARRDNLARHAVT